MIVEKLDGNGRAKYGDLLIEEISKRLTEQFGKGFSIQNLRINETILYVFSNLLDDFERIEDISLRYITLYR